MNSQISDYRLHELLAMGTPVWQAFTTDVGHTQRRRHHVTARIL